MDTCTLSFRNDLKAQTVWESGHPRYRAKCPCGQRIVFRYDGKGLLHQTEGCAHFPKFHNCGSAGIYFGEN